MNAVTRRPIRIAAILLIAFCSLGALADEAESADRTLSPYFFVDSKEPSLDRLPLEKTAVEVKISGVIADVTVRQVYKNDGGQPINAKYVFPASTRAAVHGMRMVVGDQIITAKIKKKEKARKIFETAKKQGKSASLLEQQRPNVFTMNVANVMPGDRIEVELSYTELLVPTDGTYEFVYPTVVGPRYSSQPEAAAPAAERWIESPYLPEGRKPTYGFELTGEIATGMPLQALACPSHDLRVDWKSTSVAGIELEASAADVGDRDFILRYRLAGDEIASGLLLHEGRHENFFLLMVQPPERVRTEEIPPREYVFIVDVSGSMHGFPLDTSKRLLTDLIGSLRSGDTFNVMLFAGSAQLMATRSVPATQENIARAIAVIEQQRGGGGTELLRAVKHAMGLPHDEGTSRSFVIVTDGFISAERGVFDYIRRNLGQANVYAFGIGSSVNRFLIEGLARAGMGEPFVVTEPSTAADAAARFREYVRAPVLTDIRVDYHGFQAYDVEPASIPDVLADRPIVIHGKWRGDPSGTITVSGTSGGGPYTRSFDAHAFRSSTGHRALGYLWARTRIANLSDFGEPDAEQIDEMTSLGLSYNLLTRFTSFVAVYDVIRNTGDAARNVSQPLPLPKGVSNLAVGVGDEPTLLQLLIVLASGLGATLLFRALTGSAA